MKIFANIETYCLEEVLIPEQNNHGFIVKLCRKKSSSCKLAYT